ncbi:MAG: PTS sugar transporter subunit IIA [Nibricoccus sp.]
MYLNLVQIAESFGVSEKVVEDWIRNEDMPHIPDRGRLLFDRAQIADWATARGLAAQAGFLAPTISAVSGGWKLEPLLRAGGIWRDVAPAQLLAVFARVIGSLPGATPPVRQLLSQRLQAAGGITTAPIGGGIALPHMSARVTLGRDSGTLALVFLSGELVLPEPPPDGVPVTRLFFFIAPSPRAHLDLLGRISRALSRSTLRELVLAGASDDEIFKAVAVSDAVAPGGPSREVTR